MTHLFDWQQYNLYHVIHQPAQMTAQQLHDGIRQADRRFCGARRRYQPFGRHMLDRDPRFNMDFAARNRNYDRRYRKLGLDDMPAFHADPGDVARMAAL